MHFGEMEEEGNVQFGVRSFDGIDRGRHHVLTDRLILTMIVE